MCFWGGGIDEGPFMNLLILLVGTFWIACGF